MISDGSGRASSASRSRAPVLDHPDQAVVNNFLVRGRSASARRGVKSASTVFRNRRVRGRRAG